MLCIIIIMVDWIYLRPNSKILRESSVILILLNILAIQCIQNVETVTVTFCRSKKNVQYLYTKYVLILRKALLCQTPVTCST